MRPSTYSNIIVSVLVGIFALPAAAFEACNLMHGACWDSGPRNTSPAYPNRSSSLKINPSSVPLEESFGIEGIRYHEYWDLAIVKGLGRVGAAISPSNGEESFFGGAGLEGSSEFLSRNLENRKYQSQKYALATAFGLYDNKKSGLGRVQLNLGVIGKYNKFSRNTFPGAGFSGVLGPMTFGYAQAQDGTVVDYQLLPELYWPSLETRFRQDTYSVGVFLNSLAVDYSRMEIIFEDQRPPISITLLTASLLMKRWIFTLAKRSEDSERPEFDYVTRDLDYVKQKYDLFGGMQFAATKYLMIGGYYNYYLLSEFTLGLTLFF